MRFYGEILWELQGLSIYSNLNWMEQSENDWCQIKKKAGFSKLRPAFSFRYIETNTFGKI